jgi:uncharacterized protein YfaS (alpha-2-macroglobulin family)
VRAVALPASGTAVAEANVLIKYSSALNGTYRLPPITVEPMYSPDYLARIAGEEASVK